MIHTCHEEEKTAEDADVSVGGGGGVPDNVNVGDVNNAEVPSPISIGSVVSAVLSPISSAKRSINTSLRL